MAYWESEQKRIAEEALRHLRDTDRGFGSSQIELLSKSLAHISFRDISEANKLIESVKVSAVRNAIEGISFAARQAMEETVARFHTLALSSVQQAAIETLRATEFSKVHLDAWRDLTAIANEAVHAHFAPSIAALESALPKRTLELAAQAIAEANRINISRLGALSGSSVLAGLDFSRFSEDLEHIQAIHNSYSGQMAAALRDLLNSPDISDETLKPVQDLINAKVSSLPQGRISAEGLLTLILTLIGVLLAHGNYQFDITQSRGSEKTSKAHTKQSAQLTELIQQVVLDASRLIPDNDQSSYYFVEREATLRDKPRSKSSPFGSLFPNQKVRIVQRRHKWIYVEYFDEIEGVPKYGWSYKKYFKYIPPITLGMFSPHHSPSLEIPNSLDDETYLAITNNWDAINAKRVSLIQKKIKNSITAGEERELEYLQHLADERIKLLAPLPIERFNTILDEVTRSN